MHVHRLSKEKKYCHCHCAGEFSEDGFIAILDAMIKTAIKDDMETVLIDVLAVDEIALTTLERFELGKKIALAHFQNEKSVKIVIVGNEPLIHKEKVAEMVALNRGAVGRAFHDLGEAIRWIEEN